MFDEIMDSWQDIRNAGLRQLCEELGHSKAKQRAMQKDMGHLKGDRDGCYVELQRAYKMVDKLKGELDYVLAKHRTEQQKANAAKREQQLTEQLLYRKISELQHNFDECNRQKERFRDTIREMEMEEERTQGIFHKLHDGNREFMNELGAAEQEIRRLRKDIFQLEDERDATLAEEALLQSKIKDFEDDMKRQQQEQRKVWENKIDIEERLALADEENQKLTSLLQARDTEVEDAHENEQRLRRTIAELKSDIEHLEQDSQDARAKLREAQSEIDAVQGELRKSVGMVHTLQSRDHELKQIVQNMEQEREEFEIAAQAQVVAVQQDLEDALAEQRVLQRKLDAAETPNNVMSHFERQKSSNLHLLVDDPTISTDGISNMSQSDEPPLQRQKASATPTRRTSSRLSKSSLQRFDKSGTPSSSRRTKRISYKDVKKPKGRNSRKLHSTKIQMPFVPSSRIDRKMSARPFGVTDPPAPPKRISLKPKGRKRHSTETQSSSVPSPHIGRKKRGSRWLSAVSESASVRSSHIDRKMSARQFDVSDPSTWPSHS